MDQYKLPKEVREREEQLLEDNPEAKPDIGPGHAYKAKELASGYTIDAGIDVWAVPQAKKEGGVTKDEGSDRRGDGGEHRKEKKHKKEGKEGKEHKHKKEKKEKKEKKSRHDDDDEQPRYRDKDEFGGSGENKPEQSRHRGDNNNNSSSSSSSGYYADRNNGDDRNNNNSSSSSSSSSSAPRSSLDADRWGSGPPEGSDERSSARPASGSSAMPSRGTYHYMGKPVLSANSNSNS